MNDHKILVDARFSPKRWIALLVRYILGAVIVFWLLRTDSIDFQVIDLIDFRVAVLGMLLVGIWFLLAGLRVALLLRSVGVQVELWRSMMYNSVGVFFSIFLPGGISGDLARAYYFLNCKTANRVSKAVLLGALIVDRVIGSVVMLFIGLVTITILLGMQGIGGYYLLAGWIAFFAGGLVYFWLCSLDLGARFSRDGSRISHLLCSVTSLLRNVDVRAYSKLTLVKSLTLSLGIHFITIALIFFFSNLLKTGLSFWQVMGIAPFGLIINMVPISPGGFGVGEKGFQILFALAGGANGGNTFLLSRVFFSSPAIIGLVLVMHSFIKAHRLFNNSKVTFIKASPELSPKFEALPIARAPLTDDQNTKF